MNSQRLGMLSSDVWSVSWMVVRRGQYHPDFRRPWHKGEAKLWEMTLFYLLFPFMVNTGQALGLAFMKVFFGALYFEARRLVRPIVYMSHPEDLYPSRKRTERAVFRWTDLLAEQESRIPDSLRALRDGPCGDSAPLHVGARVHVQLSGRAVSHVARVCC